MHPVMLQQLAAERVKDMIAKADKHRRARHARRARKSRPSAPMTQPGRQRTQAEPDDSSLALHPGSAPACADATHSIRISAAGSVDAAADPVTAAVASSARRASLTATHDGHADTGGHVIADPGLPDPSAAADTDRATYPNSGVSQ